MKKTMVIKRFFAYSEVNNKYFNANFIDGVNIVYGKNTSGKSTLLQSLLYTFGINDKTTKLKDVLDEKVIFRIDFDLVSDSIEHVSIIRDDELIIIKRDNIPIKKFIGISGDKSEEHKALKLYLGELFNFTLHLESSGEYKQASIESMFLPYYVAQDVGWVYRHKSFRGLDFIKNFKRDFFDYYLGIINDYDREEKTKLEKEKAEFENEIKFLSNFERKSDDILLSKLKDEKFVIEANKYIDEYTKNKTELIKLEKDYILKSNKLSYLEERKKILNKVKTALKKQVPLECNCPTCNQKLPNDIETIYTYHQNINDNNKQISDINKKIEELKKLKGTINSLEKKIQELKTLIFKDYEILSKYQIDELSFETWITNKTNVKLSENIEQKIGKIVIELDKVDEKLKAFKTDKEILSERSKMDYKFKIYFERYLKDLGVKEFDNDRFLLLYKIPAFPRQGVELLKTLLAYNFAFNKIIEETSYVHRFPFLLDAIFEGDFEDDNREKVLNFISKNYPSDTQLIFSIADSKNNQISVNDYNEKFFHKNASLICIGNNENERAFLSKYQNEFDDYLDETLELINYI